jgi:hypothetical protein
MMAERLLRLAALLGRVPMWPALDNGRLRTPAMGFSDACLGGAEQGEI